MVVLAELLAGLGLLFVGLKLMSSHLQQAMGRKVRELLKAATRSPFTGFISGTLAGAATQSSNAVAVITGNLVRGGIISTRDAIPVVAGANVGTSALVFVAAVDIRLAVLYLVGLVGMGFQFKLDRRAMFRDWLGVALGLALLFLGLDFVKTAPRHLDMAATTALLRDGLSPWMGFLLGLIAASITQSASTATILVLAAAKAGLLSLDDCFYVVLGANLGSGLAVLISASSLEGIGKQLCYVHILVKGIGCAVILAVWLAAIAMGFQPADHLANWGNHQIAASVSLLFLALQLTGALPVAALRDLMEKIAAFFSPPTLEDSASRPRFIHQEALADPVSALDLSHRETLRLIGLMPSLLPDLDQKDEVKASDRVALWRGNSHVALATDHFLVEAIGHGMPREDLDVALRQQLVLEISRSLQDTLHDFSALIDSFDPAPPLAFNLSESLRALTFQLVDTLPGAAEDFDLLIEITADRSELLNRIRRTLAGASVGAEEDARRLLLATSLFERSVWLIHRLAVALRPGGNEATSSDIEAASMRDDADAY